MRCGMKHVFVAEQYPVQHSRVVDFIMAGHAATDGAGVKLTRVFAQSLQVRLDPFLLLDAFATDSPDDYIAGFPSHPHRGFETVTYMLAGCMRHKDSAGHEGLMGAGDVQWMTAGRGVIHSEMPEQQEGQMEGFQLWLNLKSNDKMCAPWYRDITSDTIPELQGEGVLVRIIAGSSHGVAGAVHRDVTQPLYLDVHLDAGVTFTQPLDAACNSFLYVYRGSVQVADGETVNPKYAAVLANTAGSDGVSIRAGAEGARLLLLAGMPLQEPIAQMGPFVMNTQGELQQAVRDYRAGTLAE